MFFADRLNSSLENAGMRYRIKSSHKLNNHASEERFTVQQRLMDRRSLDDLNVTKATLYNTVSLVDRPKVVNFNHLPGFRQAEDSTDHDVLQKLLEDVSGTPILNSLEKMMQ